MNGASSFLGNVGIGKAAASTKLEVVGTISGSTVLGSNGITTKVIAGACSDSNAQGTDGTMCIDSTDGRVYFRYSGAWHYAAQTAGFQIPNIVTDGTNETQGLGVGDYVIGHLNQRLSDGALHGLYVKFDLTSEIAKTLAAHPEILLNLSGSGSSDALSLPELQDLTIKGALSVSGTASFLGNVSVMGELTVSGKQAGLATIPQSGTSVTVLFPERFAGTPVVTASSDDFTPWRLAQRSQTGFVIEIQHPAERQITFDWTALSTAQPTLSHGVAATGALTPFPVDILGVPVSTNAVWNACIRHHVLLDANGQPFSCERYHTGTSWDHPDLHMTFIWNGNHDPMILLLPSGYVAVVQDDADPRAGGSDSGSVKTGSGTLSSASGSGSTASGSGGSLTSSGVSTGSGSGVPTGSGSGITTGTGSKKAGF